MNPVHRRTVLDVYKPEKPDHPNFKVGDRVTVTLQTGRRVDAVVKAVVVEHTDETRLQVDYGNNETALVYLWQVHASDSSRFIQ
jgi:hypothetical protein